MHTLRGDTLHICARAAVEGRVAAPHALTCSARQLGMPRVHVHVRGRRPIHMAAPSLGPRPGADTTTATGGHTGAQGLQWKGRQQGCASARRSPPMHHHGCVSHATGAAPNHPTAATTRPPCHNVILFSRCHQLQSPWCASWSWSRVNFVQAHHRCGGPSCHCTPQCHSHVSHLVAHFLFVQRRDHQDVVRGGILRGLGPPARRGRCVHAHPTR